MAFTVGIEGADDLSPARDVARYLGIEHHEYLYTKDEIAEVLPQVIYHLESFEEDCVPGAVANFFASRLASEYTNCVLSGEGADEFLGGYHELKRARNRAEMSKLLDELIAVAYNTGLQRLDRAMAAHSVEFRPPFLDLKVTEFCHKLPLEWKVYGQEQVEKWILRKAFSHRLPEHILWRVKRPFGQGTGSSQVMRSIAENHVSPAEFEACRCTEEGLTLHSPQELYYYRIFKEKFPHPALSYLVAKWDPYKPDFRI
jgi:asparagine synthase (glutamine-hydrolysing)